ncbi:hypothetical protein GEV02_21340 [Rugamonas sp. FT29W]|uniref:Uncharacterized protein n=1 Tax=Rugamonas aquatica TaxID=2743357 RepID=A0A6A7N6T4_9BURK|nr:hypothetical protein [Rugamonas aquatica]
MQISFARGCSMLCNAIMEMDAEALCRAAYGERIDDRINSRNGHRDRVYETVPAK